MEPELISVATESIPDWAKGLGSVGVGGVGFWFLLKFMLRKISEENSGRAQADAEYSLIENLRQEIVRLSDANRTLQTQVFELNKKMVELTSENTRLRLEIHALMKQIGAQQK